MSNAVLVLNAGSSSVKFSVFTLDGGLIRVLQGEFANLPHAPRYSVRDGDGNLLDEKTWPVGRHLTHADAVGWLFAGRTADLWNAHRLVAVGHRVVHGGVQFTRPARITADVLAQLETLVPLAPLHQPHNLSAIRAVAAYAPDLEQVACFDTSFHQTQPELAQMLALPRRYFAEGIRRYGFHGISYEYIAAALEGIDARGASGRTIVAHLGAGASLCALSAGRSIATTMGFTPIDGLVMATRCGLLDAGVLLHLLDRDGLSVSDLKRLLWHESGLLGVSGISGDMRTLLANSEPAAVQAVDLFVYRVAREIGSLAAALGGLDALVFTAGIGEHAPLIRSRICRSAAWLGVELDEAANARNAQRISLTNSPVSVWVIPTNEELVIARNTVALLPGNSADPGT